ncbi:MAG: zinc ribbon domain-containing protein [candidate division Zixibacteria bacterium]|nr:zinc ribbon domain-containing protein [candidate division Zixibacteria bacterium]
MPIYEYRCNECDEKFELLRSCSDNSDIVCPKCGQGDVTKMFSAFAGGISGSAPSNCGAPGGFS